MDYFELARELDNYFKYGTIELNFDMSLREFIAWLLNLPISIYIFTILFALCLNILIWYIKHPPKE